jgi:hypothetical protein
MKQRKRKFFEYHVRNAGCHRPESNIEEVVFEKAENKDGKLFDPSFVAFVCHFC